ncbi:MAG: pseudouridine synthase, partial [Bacteroidia bacterium]|nr:pseudouridine synthase [Bacteroidia bacterium]
LTNNGAIIHKIIHPDFEHEKEYIVTVNMPLRNQFLKDMAAGVNIGAGEFTKACIVKPELGTKRVFRIILKQGLNRQIRRMCNVYGYQVLKLQRIRIMNIKLEKLKTGEWRELNEDELSQII